MVIASDKDVLAGLAKLEAAHQQRGMDRMRWMRDYVRNVYARYDVAQTTPENERFWINSDYKSPRSAGDRSVRQKIRARARYEAQESGSHAKGIVLAKTNDVIGKGPALQVLTGNKEFNKALERKWTAWAREINLPAKLRTMYAAKVVDGEAFAERINNQRLRNGVNVDIRVTEADLWTDPLWAGNSVQEDDGIRYDRVGNPELYRRLKYHPGDNFTDLSPLDYEDLGAENVIHWFRKDRPDQRRGISELAPSLPLFAELRRYRLAVLAASEIAANYAAVMYSDAPAFGEDPDDMEEAFMEIELHRRAMITLPGGWKMQQLRAEQPTTQFSEFCESILAEIGRVTLTPLNIVLGSSRDYNFASGRLDYLLYWQHNDIDRCDCDMEVLERLFEWFVDEALLIPGFLPEVGTDDEGIPHRFVFPPRRPIDEENAAKADMLNMQMGHLSDEQWAVRENIDLETHYEELKRMTDERAKCGFPVPSTANDGANNGNSPTKPTTSPGKATANQRRTR